VGLVEIATQLQNGASALLGASSYSAVSSSAWLEGRGDHESLRVLLERGTRYSLLVTWPIALCTAFLADAAIHLWLGSRYIEAAGLTALALVPLVGAPLQVGSNMLRGTGRVRDIVRPAFVSTMVNLVASVAFVYRYGVVGAFLGTIIATLILVPYLGRSVFRAFSVEPWRFCQRAVAPVLIPTLALTLVLTIVVVADLSPAATLVIGGIAGLGAYVPLAFFVAVPRAERLEIRELLRRPSSSREDARDWPHTLAG
jgi:O-antigen/teichoic acid export membrane protein